MPEALPVEKTQRRASVETHFKRVWARQPGKTRKSMAAKNLPKNGLQKPSKPADSLHLNQPGRNPKFSVTPLCPIFARISAQPDNDS
jgi:hypothetical protein